MRTKTKSILPEFDIWPPPPKSKTEPKPKKDDLPRNASFRKEDLNLEGDQAVYEGEETEEDKDKRPPGES